MLEEPGICKNWKFGRVSIDILKSLERRNPKPFAVEDMNHLFPQRVEAEAGQLAHIDACWESGQVAE
jgi:hypothetical protein